MNGISYPAFRSAVAPLFRRIMRTVRDTIVRRAVDKALSALDDRTLGDLAISRGEIAYLSNLATRALVCGEGGGKYSLEECIGGRFAPRCKADNDNTADTTIAA